MTGTAPPDPDNVLLTDWTGPFGGVPAFDRMELDALKPALESGMANQLVDNLFAVGNAVDPAEAYRKFRGRDATIDALMRDRGFPVP
ncbi:MAG: hypothetical protein VX427_14570 [Acidobacteriota bacterium]|nr:hypothetical protein [Acidobacteriota bacterium]